jgi:cytochrome c-type biogenesis protein CcsB
MRQFLISALALYAVSLALMAIRHAIGKISLETASRRALVSGFLAHTVSLGLRAVSTGHAPMASMYETLIFYSWTATLLSLVVIYRYRERSIEFVTMGMAMVALVFSFFNESPGKSLTLILDTRWFEAHVTASFAAYAFFTLAFGAALMYLIRLKMGQDDRELSKFQTVASRAVLWGFMFFSVSMFAGAVWGYLAWGAYWMWEPKIIWSFIVWFYYAGAMHAAYVRRWRGTGLAIATVFGIFVVLFTYLGVGLLMKSSHSF